MNSQNLKITDIDEIPLNIIIKRILSFWYLFILGISISLIVAFIYLNDKQNIYRIIAHLKLNDQTKDNRTNQSFMKEMDIFTSSEKLEDEIGILTSFDLMKQTLKKLNSSITYHKKGIWGNLEIDPPDIPYSIELDSFHVQLTGIPIFISRDGDEYIVSGDADYSILYLPAEFEDKGKVYDILFKNRTDNLSFKNKYLSFRIIPNPKFEYENIDKRNFFVIHTIDKHIRSIRKKLKIIPLTEEGNLLELSTYGPLIEEEKKFLDTLISVYLNNERIKKFDLGQNVINLINNKIETIEDSLISVENELEMFRASSKIINIQTTSEELTKQLLALEGEKSKIEGQNQQFKLILNYLERQEAGTESVAPSAINVNDPILAPIWTQLTDLYQRRSQLQQSAKADNPQMQRLEREITNVEKQLTENARNRVESSEISLRKVKERIYNTKIQINKLPGNEKRLRQLQREYNLIDNTYQYLLQKREETSIALANTLINKEIVDNAYLSSNKPISPNRFIIFIIASLFGIFLPLSILLLIDFFDNRVKGFRDIYVNTDIPLIGIISSGKSGTQLLDIGDSDDIKLESFRALRIQLRNRLMHNEKSSHVIGITSTWANEGKTYVSANLSCAIAMAGKKTVIIDLDLRKSSLLRYFPYHENEKGVSAYLLEDLKSSDIINPTSLNNLDYISAGPVNRAALDYIESEKFYELINVLKEMYDYVIIDTPPIGQTSDYFNFKDVIDFTLYIIRHKQTPKNSLKLLNQLNEQLGNPSLGLVINDVPKKDAFGNGDGVFGYGKKLEY